MCDFQINWTFSLIGLRSFARFRKQHKIDITLLPDLCHLSEEDRVLYKVQVAEREEARLRGEF